MGMKQILVMMAAVVLVGQSVLADEEKLIADPIVEKKIRLQINKPEGKLTLGDLDKILGLDLSGSKINDDSLQEVAKLENLVGLNLNGTQITGEGLKALVKLQRLEELALNSTQITDVSLKELAKLKKIKVLGLFRTKVTRAGVTELKKALPNCNIRSFPKK